MNPSENIKTNISREEEKLILDSLEDEFFQGNDFPGHQTFNPEKNGIIFPVLMWIVSIVIIALFTIFINKIIKTPGSESGISPIMISNRKDSLLSVYKTEAEEAISQKSEEVDFYKEKVDEYDQKLEYLRNLLAAQSGTENNGLNEGYQSVESIQGEIQQIEEEKQRAVKLLETRQQEIKQLDPTFEIITDPPQSSLDSFLNHEYVLTEQVSGLYNQAISSIRNNEPEQAGQSIASLKKLINRELPEDLPQARARQAIDLQMIRFLEESLESSQQNLNVQEMESLKQLMSAQESVRTGEDLLNRGKNEEALNYYRLGLASLPSLNDAMERILDYELGEQAANYNQQLSDSAGTVIDDPADAVMINSVSSEAVSSDVIMTEAAAADTTPQPLGYDLNNIDLKLFGLVQSQRGTEILIEPFFKMEVSAGDSFLIKEPDSNEAGLFIAEGIIAEVGNSSITGEILSLKERTEIKISRDLIYLIR